MIQAPLMPFRTHRGPPSLSLAAQPRFPAVLSSVRPGRALLGEFGCGGI